MANKVWVAVVPNTKNFASDLRKFLTRIEKALELHVDVRADTSRAENAVRTSVARMSEQVATINVEADTRHAERQVKNVAESRDATVNVDADTGLASTQIAAVSRRRKVELVLEVSKRSLATVGTALAALSGARVARSALSSIGTALSNLDRSVPAIAGLALSIGSLGSVALSSVSGIVTLGASLGPLLAFAAPLPGLMLAGGAAIGVFAAAMVDAGSKLGSLKSGFSGLQDSISGAFWKRAQQPILDLVNGVLPSLQSGLTKVAASLGSWSASVAGSFQKAFSPSVVGTITGQLAASINASVRGTDAFAASIAALGTFAAQYLPGIGNWFSDISIRFNGFIQTVTSNGQLAGWVQEAQAVLGQLGAVFSNTFGILGNVANAAFAAGGSGLQTLASGLAAIDQLTAGPAFQGALTTVFQGAAAGAAGLAAALGPVGTMFANLAPSISSALAGLGSTAGALIGGIADALNQPVVAAGIESAVSGIATAVQGILPALPALGAAFGTLMGVVGQLAGTLGPVLGAALSALAPVITSLATALAPVIATLGPALVQVISTVAPVVAQLAAAFAPLISAVLPVLQAALGAILPALSALMPAFSMLIPPIVQVVGVLASALVPVITAVAPLIMAAVQAVLPIVSQLAGVFMQLMPTLMQLIPPIVQIATTLTSILIPVIQAVMPVVSAVISAVLPIVQSLVTVITGVVNVIAGLLSGNFSQAWKGAQQIVSGVWGAISGIVTGALSIIRSVITAGLNVIRSVFSGAWNAAASIVSGATSRVVGFVRSMASGIGSGISQAVGFFQSLGGKITGAVSGFGSLLVSVGKNVIQGFINGAKSMAGSILSAVTSPIKDAIAGAKSLLGIHSPSRVFRQIGVYVGQGLQQGLKGSASGVQTAARSMTNAVLDAFDSKKVTAAQSNGLLRAVASGNRQLESLARQRGAVASKLSAASKSLTAAVSARDKYRDSVLTNLTKVNVTDSASGGSLIENLQRQLDQTKAFTSTMSKLRKAGLDAASYQQFIAKGVSALPLAQDLLAGGTAEIRKVSSLQGQLAKASSSFASSAANDLYGAGVAAAQGLVKGLQSQQAAIAKQMHTIASTMVRSVKRTLGIHSPSRVFRDEVGKQIVAGLAMGVTRNAGTAHSAIDDLAGYVPSAALSRAASFPSGSSVASAPALPESITLLDQDGSILTRARVIATAAVDAGQQALATTLQTGTR